MKPIADVVNAISGVINGLTLPAREKKELLCCSRFSAAVP